MSSRRAGHSGIDDGLRSLGHVPLGRPQRQAAFNGVAQGMEHGSGQRPRRGPMMEQWQEVKGEE